MDQQTFEIFTAKPKKSDLGRTNNSRNRTGPGKGRRERGKRKAEMFTIGLVMLYISPLEVLVIIKLEVVSRKHKETPRHSKG